MKSNLLYNARMVMGCDGVQQLRRGLWVCGLCNWDVDDLAIVSDDSKTEDCERFAFGSSDAGEVYSPGTFVTLHSEREVYVPLWHAYDAVYPWVPVEIPNRFRPDSIS